MDSELIPGLAGCPTIVIPSPDEVGTKNLAVFPHYKTRSFAYGSG